MKKVLIFTNILFLGAAVFLGLGSCNDSTKPDVTVVDTAQCTPCMAYNDVGYENKLDENLVRTMAYYYRTNPSNASNSRSVWFSLQKMKEFIHQIESKTCKCPGNLGMRVYFGIYPPDGDWSGAFKDDLDNNNNPARPNFRQSILGRFGSNLYANRNTVFMIPTIWNGSKNVDFDPADASYSCRGGYNPNRYVGKDTSISYVISHAAGSPITALSATNHGDACPPPIAGCTQEGAMFDH
jgi:hypothetical protein